MYGLHKLSLFLVYSVFRVLGANQVAAHINDALNPVKVSLDVWTQRHARLAVGANSDLECEKPPVYICEEPPNAVSPESQKTCNYRNQRYHEQVFRWVAGRGCLLYTHDFLFVDGSNPLNLNAGCFYGNWYAPCLEIAKDDGTCGCYPFDPSLEEVAVEVRRAMIPAAHGRWESCYYTASDCCAHYMTAGNYTDGSKCEATFDGWTCWGEAEAGTVAQEVCSDLAYSGQGPTCHHFSNKECFKVNDTFAVWDIQTDYSTCSIAPRLLRRYRFYIATLSISIIACLPAVFVFLFYKRLRITRVALHRNLLIAIIIRNVLVIVSRSEIYIDELSSNGATVMSEHGIGCRILAVSERVASNAVFVCMLIEGVFLHRMIVAVFRQKLRVKWLYAVGAVIAIVPVIAWAIVMGIHDDHSCWLVYTVPHIQWILDGPRVAVLIVNTALFADVLRVLLTKIRNAENANQLSTAKATLFLMPIFGTQFLLTAFRPNTTNCTGEQIYFYVSYAVEGLQGFIVAMLYCYVNKEVHTLVKATYKKTENAVVSRVRRDSTYPYSTGPNDRRMTYSTALSNNRNVRDHDSDSDHNTQMPYKDINKAEPQVETGYGTVQPKLHVAEIISIRPSESLAEILDPVYETIGHDMGSEFYDSLERSDNDSGFIPVRDVKEEYYGFTNASSISIDCDDWIRCISSPSTSIYCNSLNEREIKYLERKFPQQLQEIQSRYGVSAIEHLANYKNIQLDTRQSESGSSSAYNSENMLAEIMQYIDKENRQDIVLDPNLLCPNRKEEDRIIFLND